MRPFRVGPALLAAACLLPLASRGAAQGPAYSKSDLIRMLAAGTPRLEELAAQIGFRCVSFKPTARDLLDLRTIGADSAVLHNVANCADPSAPIRLVLPAVVSVAAGTQATIEARLVRGTVPQPGIRLMLRGTRALPGGLGMDPGAVTDAGGVARFRLGVGTRIGTYPLEVIAATGTPRVQGFLDLTVTPAPATRADVTPTDLVFVQGGQVPIAVRVEVRDDPGGGRFLCMQPDSAMKTTKPVRRHGICSSAIRDLSFYHHDIFSLAKKIMGHRLPAKLAGWIFPL